MDIEIDGEGEGDFDWEMTAAGGGRGETETGIGDRGEVRVEFEIGSDILVEAGAGARHGGDDLNTGTGVLESQDEGVDSGRGVFDGDNASDGDGDGITATFFTGKRGELEHDIGIGTVVGSGGTACPRPLVTDTPDVDIGTGVASDNPGDPGINCNDDCLPLFRCTPLTFTFTPPFPFALAGFTWLWLTGGGSSKSRHTGDPVADCDFCDFWDSRRRPCSCCWWFWWFWWCWKCPGR